MIENKKFFVFNPSVGYPAGDNVFYTCLRCGDTLPSLPKESRGCTCHNITIDVDYGRVSIKDQGQAKYFVVSP